MEIIVKTDITDLLQEIPIEGIEISITGLEHPKEN